MKEVRKKDLLYPELSYEIIGSAFDVSNKLGGGHHEKYYQRALAEAFLFNKLKFSQQTYFPLKYNDKIVGKNFVDFVVENKVVVEIKKGNQFSKRNINQVLEYLALSNLELAILINFGSNGVSFRRIVNFKPNS